MIYATDEEAMKSLIGHRIVEYGQGDSLPHFTLDDGRILVFIGMGILLADEHVVH